MAEETSRLLKWVKNRVDGYPGVDVQDFSRSWRDGLAFLALIHHYHPDLVDFDNLRTDEAVENVKIALKISKETLHIEQIIEPEDVLVEEPDSNKIYMQINEWKKYFDGKEPHIPFGIAIKLEDSPKVDQIIEQEKQLERKGSKKQLQKRLTNFNRQSLMRSTSIDRAVVNNIMLKISSPRLSVVTERENDNSNISSREVTSQPTTKEKELPPPSLASLLITLVIMILSLLVFG
jgi:hypothetical protein